MDDLARAPRLSRRRVLRLGAAACGAFTLPLLGACGSAGAPPAAPTAAPAKPAEAAKPAAEAKSTEAAKPAAESGSGSKPAQAAPAGQAKTSEVNIAALFPLSGELARMGETCLNAAKLAADDINAAGGVKALGGAKINVVSSDLRSDDRVTRTETERVLTSNKITAVTGCYASALTLVASEVTERQKVPIITGSVTNPLIERGFRYIFQVSPRASMIGEAQVKLAVEAAGNAKKAAVIYENTAYGTSTSKGVQDVASQVGLEITLMEPYERAFTDAGPLVNKVRAANADVLFPISYLNDLILIVRTARQQNVRVPIVAGGAGTLLPDFGKTFGDEADGVLSVSVWNWDMTDDTKAVNTKYEGRHGEFMQEHAGETYAFMYVLLDAMERAGSDDPTAVRDALATTNIGTGLGAMMPGGKVTFDERGWNANVFPLGVQWQRGQLLTVYPKEAARAAYFQA